MGVRKVLFQTKLTELTNSDKDGIGTLREDEFGRVFRFVKNASSTALVACGPCLKPLTSVSLAAIKKVYTIDVGSEVTASVKCPAGVAMSAIAASGTDNLSTMCYGWIQVEGPKRVNFYASDTTLAIGMVAIATSGLPASAIFGPGYAEVANSATSAYAYAKYVQVMKVPATDGAATAISCAVDLHLL